MGTSYGAKFKEETAVAKYFTQAQDQLTSQLPDEPDTSDEIAASFDDLWNMREWSIKDGIVDMCFEKTRKVIDVVIQISDCPHCKKMKVKHLSREIEYTDDLNWYVQHKLECPMSQNGSAQALAYFSLFL